MGEAVRLLGAAFADWRDGRAGNQVRRRLFEPDGAVLHSMAGWQGRYFGTKFYSTSAQGAHFFFYLFERESGRPLARFEANWLGQIRTGAASGLATSRLANPDARVLTVFGAGFQAQGQIAAIRQVRPEISEVRIWSRTPSKRQNCDTAEEAVRGADILCTATFARDPVLETRWLKPGAHINAIGSNNPHRRELPADTIESARVVAVDSVEACQVEAGDLLLARLDWSKLVELKDLETDWKPEGHSVFKSVGLGLEDVAVAGYVYEQIILETASSDQNPATR
jgi:alanine dehydrogenase